MGECLADGSAKGFVEVLADELGHCVRYGGVDDWGKLGDNGAFEVIKVLGGKSWSALDGIAGAGSVELD